MSNFENLPLHDAVVENIDIKWGSSFVGINLYAFVNKAERALPFILKFIGVTEIQVPHNSPWGESVYVNRVGVENERFYIEMQSGDMLAIKANDFKFEPTSL